MWPVIAWNVVRTAATRALPWAWNAGRSLLGAKPTIAGIAAVSAAPTLLSMLDNSTGNALSESLLNTPLGPALEKLLEVNEFSNDQKASVVTNLIDNGLESSGRMSESDPDYERSKRLTEAFGHLIVGDQLGAASIAGELGIQTSDLIESYNQAKAANPDGTIQDIGAASFVELREQMSQRDLHATTESPATAAAAPTQPSNSGQSLSLDTVPDSQISALFEEAADNAGAVWGTLLKFASAISDVFGKKANFQKWMLDTVLTSTRYEALQGASERGNVVSRIGNQLGLDQGFSFSEPELAT